MIPRHLSYIPGRISQRKYTGLHIVVGSNGTITLDVLYAIRFYVGTHPDLFDALFFTSASGVASSLFRIGAYTDDNGRPDRLIVDSGQISTATNGEKSYAHVLSAQGSIWLAGVTQGVASNVARVGLCYDPCIGSTNVFSVAFGGMGYSQTGISGAMPSAWGSTYTPVSTANAAPMLFLRKK